MKINYGDSYKAPHTVLGTQQALKNGINLVTLVQLLHRCPSWEIPAGSSRGS